MTEEAEQKINIEPEQLAPADEPLPQHETPALASQLAQEVDEHDLLDEQFNNYLNIANSLLKTLQRTIDIEICTDLITKVERLNASNNLVVKSNNNQFFRYFLKILYWTSNNQPLECYQCLYNCNTDSSLEQVTESRHWLENNKNYMALKTFKDGTSIMYTAVSDNPEAGWQDGGLNILAKREACTRN